MTTRPSSRARGTEPDAITVRPASLNDVDAIVRFRMALLKEHARHSIFGRVRDDVEPRMFRSTSLALASGRQITYLALEGRLPVGMLRCLEAKGSPLLLPSRYAYISSAFVAPTHRRRGILTRLVDAAVTWSRARGLTEVRLHSTPDNIASSAVWERLGFPTVEHLRRREVHRAPGA